MKFVGFGAKDKMVRPFRFGRNRVRDTLNTPKTKKKKKPNKIAVKILVMQSACIKAFMLFFRVESLSNEQREKSK